MKKVISLGIIILFGIVMFGNLSLDFIWSGYHHSSPNEIMSSVYAQGEDPWLSYTYNNIIVEYPSNWQADYTNPEQVNFHGTSTSDGNIAIGVLAIPVGYGTNLADKANQIYGSIEGTNIVQGFTPTIVGGHEAASGIVSMENGSIQSKVTLIKYDSNTLYLLQFLSSTDIFGSNENNQIMNRAITSVSFVK